MVNLYRVRTRILSCALAILLNAGTLGCGSQNQVDPLSLGETSLTDMLYNFSLNVTGGFAGSVGYSASHPYWSIPTNSFTTFVSPAAGIVVESGLGSRGYFVKIQHTGRLATRIEGIGLPTLRIGDSVARGQTIGNLVGFSGYDFVDFYVFLDGVSVCPMSFVHSSFRSTIFTGSLQACQ